MAACRSSNSHSTHTALQPGRSGALVSRRPDCADVAPSNAVVAPLRCCCSAFLMLMHPCSVFTNMGSALECRFLHDCLHPPERSQPNGDCAVQLESHRQLVQLTIVGQPSSAQHAPALVAECQGKPTVIV
jgi:hypothetical protein